MPPRKWRERISDIVEAALRIATFTSGLTFEQFAADQKTIAAVSSYEVYLTHMFVVLGFAQLHFAGSWLLAIGLSAVAGALTARRYSEPLNRLLRGSRIAA